MPKMKTMLSPHRDTHTTHGSLTWKSKKGKAKMEGWSGKSFEHSGPEHAEGCKACIGYSEFGPCGVMEMLMNCTWAYEAHGGNHGKVNKVWWRKGGDFNALNGNGCNRTRPFLCIPSAIILTQETANRYEGA